jgi:phage terminase small subunit
MSTTTAHPIVDRRARSMHALARNHRNAFMLMRPPGGGGRCIATAYARETAAPTAHVFESIPAGKKPWMDAIMSKRGPKVRRRGVIPLAQEWDAPAHLGPIARREFDHAVDLLRQRDRLDKADSTLVVRRAELCELAELLYRELAKGAVVVVSDRGNLSVHPAARQLTSTAAAIKAIDETLELTPSTARAVASQPGSYGEWQGLLGATS